MHGIIGHHSRVQCLLLVRSNGGVGGLESELVGRAPTEAALKDESRVAVAKVRRTTTRRGVVLSGSIIRVIRSGVVLSGSVIRSSIVFSIGVLTTGIISSRIISRSVVGGGIVRSRIISRSILSAGIIRGSIISGNRLSTGKLNLGARSILGNKVGESLLDGNLGLGETGGVEGSLKRGGRVRVLHVGTLDGGVEEGQNATECLGGGERGVGAQSAGVSSEVVEVLLSSYEGGSTGDDLGIVAKLGHDLVGERKLNLMLAAVDKYQVEKNHSPSRRRRHRQEGHRESAQRGWRRHQRRQRHQERRWKPGRDPPGQSEPRRRR